jgi:ADP-ribose pyrophosphatase YjhB (NUDIX family)
MRCGARLGRARQEGRLRHRCPRCGWVFYDNPVPAALALISRGERILLGRRAAPPYARTWDLPGGFLEAGETPEQGLARELREELGVDASVGRLVGFFTETYGRGGFPILAAVYHVRLGTAPRPASDITALSWFPRGRLPLRQVAFPALRRFLAQLARRAGAGRPASRRRRARRGRGLTAARSRA